MTPGSGSGGAGGGGSRLTAQEAIEMLQKILVISSSNNANANANGGRNGGGGGGDAGGEGRIQQVPPPLEGGDDDEEGEGAAARGEGVGEEGLRSPTPFEETGGACFVVVCVLCVGAGLSGGWVDAWVVSCSARFSMVYIDPHARTHIGSRLIKHPTTTYSAESPGHRLPLQGRAPPALR